MDSLPKAGRLPAGREQRMQKNLEPARTAGGGRRPRCRVRRGGAAARAGSCGFLPVIEKSLDFKFLRISKRNK